jgi:hypothetical protein
MSAKGLVELNAENNPPKDSDYYVATVVDENTIELNTVNSTGFKAYSSGGQVVYNTPMDLSGYTARMSIKDRAGGTELMSLTTENGRIEVDNTAKVINLIISADDTADITWKKGVYDLELVAPGAGGVVTMLLYGKATVSAEVTS